MYVVIVGCGRMGALAARMLANEGPDVAVIARNRQTFDRLGSVFNGVTVEGGGFDEQVLLQAGIERADVFVAATDSDNANIMAAEIARNLFGVSHVVVRTYDPSKEYAYQRLGWNTICASVLGATKIRDEVLKTGVVSQMVLGGGEAEIIRFRPTRNVAGNTVGELEQVGDFRRGQDVALEAAAPDAVGRGEEREHRQVLCPRQGHGVVEARLPHQGSRLDGGQQVRGRRRRRRGGLRHRGPRAGGEPEGGRQADGVSHDAPRRHNSWTGCRIPVPGIRHPWRRKRL